MNSKKVNWFFLTTILLHVFIVVLLVVFRYVFTLGIVANFIVSSGIILIPALIFLVMSGESFREMLGFHRIKWSTAGMIVLFTFLTMPLTTLINAFSMLFVENAVMEMSGEVLELPFLAAFFFMAVSAPICEEIVFRGVVYHGYRRSGTLFQAMLLSAMVFAIGHLNFNQAAYAFVIGILLVLLVEATGSIWASIIYHVVFNGYSVCVMYLTDALLPQAMEAQQMLEDHQAYIDSMIYSIAVSVISATAASAIAVCVFIWIAKNENRLPRIRQIWTTRHDKREKMITAPLLFAVVLALAYMVLNVILDKMM